MCYLSTITRALLCWFSLVPCAHVASCQRSSHQWWYSVHQQSLLCDILFTNLFYKLNLRPSWQKQNKGLWCLCLFNNLSASAHTNHPSTGLGRLLLEIRKPIWHRGGNAVFPIHFQLDAPWCSSRWRQSPQNSFLFCFCLDSTLETSVWSLRPVQLFGWLVINYLTQHHTLGPVKWIMWIWCE